MDITNEQLAAYAEGNVSEEERMDVRQYLTENPQEWDSVLMMMDEDYDLTLDDEEIASLNTSELDHNLGELLDELSSPADSLLPSGNVEEVGGQRESQLAGGGLRILPAMAMAAENKVDNLCAIHCEGIALRLFGFDITDEQLLDESRKKRWLQKAGTALHNIGRLSGTRGLSVSHRYQCSLDDIRASLSANNVVIAAVDGNELTGDYEAEQEKDVEQGMTPNHVVIVNIITEDSVIVTDSATPEQMDVYPLPQFLDAWEDSENFLTVISNGGEYTPHPINLHDVDVEEELLELQEAIAENAHEVWAETRSSEGWTYGPFRDDEKKQHPDLVPYNLLPESEKEYDRLMAMNTIKLVKKLGWEFTKKDTTVKKARPAHAEKQSPYTETEKRAITTIFLKLLCIDTKIVSSELIVRGNVYKQFGITHQHEQKLLPFNEALGTYKAMTNAKRAAVRKALHQLSNADNDVAEKENTFIENLDK